MRALSARSIVASTLLGTLPPRLPGRLLVAFAQEFGVNPGTTRVALTRMVDRGELAREHGGHYALSGALLERQRWQEDGLAASVRAWSGGWEMCLVRGGARDSTERASLRRSAARLGLGERREGVWLRPDNLDPERLPVARAVVVAQTESFTAAPVADPAGVAAELFDLASWADEARRLQVCMTEMEATLDKGRSDALTSGFEIAAQSLRHLVSDPLLPAELFPSDWPAIDLRASYENYNRTYRAHLSDFFRSRSRLTE